MRAFISSYHCSTYLITIIVRNAGFVVEVINNELRNCHFLTTLFCTAVVLFYETLLMSIFI